MTAPKAKTHPAANRAWRRRRMKLFQSILRPPDKLTVTECAERYRQLSREASAEPGRFRCGRTPYLREIMDAFCDPAVEVVVWMKPAQVGGTTALENVALYFIVHDPMSMLLMQPSIEMAMAWAEDRLETMIRDTPRLGKVVAPSRSRDAGSRKLKKRYAGGVITITGANSPRSLRSRSVPIVLMDERDAYPFSAGKEGDPGKLAWKRAQTFPYRKRGDISTPLIKGASPTEAEYEKSDQRRYHVPCPHCEHPQVLRWEQLHWEKIPVAEATEADRARPGMIEHNGKLHLTETAAYTCEECGVAIDEHEKPGMLAAGAWVARHPNRAIRGYHLNALYSPFDGARWAKLLEEWLNAQGDPSLLQVFYNTVLAQTWEERGDRLDATTLAMRRELYAAEVPAGVGVLTAAVDVQDDRLELLVVGWGRGEEAWIVAHHKIWGDPQGDSVWKRLDILRKKLWRHESGAMLRIQAMCVDTGAHTDRCYDWIKPRQGQGVWGVKGDRNRGKALLIKPGKAKRRGIRLLIVGTHTAKTKLFGRLRLEPERDKDKRILPGKPGYIHIPLAQDDGAGDDFLMQFENEKLVTRKVSGQLVRQYIQTGPNEAIDLMVYNTAALHTLGDAVRGHLGQWVDRVNADGKGRAVKTIIDRAVAIRDAVDDAAARFAERLARDAEASEEVTDGADAASDPELEAGDDEKGADDTPPDPAPAPALTPRRPRKKKRRRGGGGWISGL